MAWGEEELDKMITILDRLGVRANFFIEGRYAENHKNQVLSRVQLLDSIWDVAGDFVNDNTLTVYIKRLREKLEDNPQKPTLIQTVRGLGYKLEVKE